MILGPLLISVVARTLGWALLFGGNNGLVNKLLMSLGLIGSPLRFMFTETGMVVALTHVLMPFMVLSVWAALQRVDPQIENAALSLGAGPLTIIRRIVLPQIMPGVLSGAIIVFSLAASAFATPAIIGGRRLKVAATLAYDEFLNTLNWPLGAAVAVLLLLALVLIVVGSNASDRAALCRGVPMRTNGPLALIFHAIFVVVHAGADRGGVPRRFHARGLSVAADHRLLVALVQGDRELSRVRPCLLGQSLAGRAVLVGGAAVCGAGSACHRPLSFPRPRRARGVVPVAVDDPARGAGYRLPALLHRDRHGRHVSPGCWSRMSWWCFRLRSV